MEDDDQLLDTREAAALLGVSVDGLATWRARRIGPRWCRIGEGMGRIRYRRSDLRRYVEAQTYAA